MLKSLLTLSLLLFLSISAFPSQNGDEDKVLKAFQQSKIIPDVLSTAKSSPQQELKVTYGNKDVDLGTQLTEREVQSQPTLKWAADRNSLYTIAKVDPDAPYPENAWLREYCHWLLVNVRGSDLSSGNVITEYAGATPPKGNHRYVFLVYKQTKRLDTTKNDDRDQFHIEQFANQNGLGRPVAGNYYLCQP